MSYSPFFLSGFQHASSTTTVEKLPQRHGSFSSTQSASTSRVRRQRSSAHLGSLANSLPPSASLPEIPPSPTPSSFMIPKTPTKSSDVSHLAPERSSANVRRSIPFTTVLRSNSTVSTSATSTRNRRNKRSDALERLEGRSSQWYFKARDSWMRSRSVRKRNDKDFMSMNDDSDSDENDDSFIDVELKIHPRIRFNSSPLLSSPTRTSFWFSSKRSSKLLTPFAAPPHSFIDLAENDTRAKWKERSFIEISPPS